MEKFNGNKKIKDIIADAGAKGWEVDTEKFNTGSDWIYLRDMYGQVKSNEGIPKQIAFNTTNGHFFVFEPLSEKSVATHMSSELDNEEWYSEILNLVYETITS